MTFNNNKADKLSTESKVEQKRGAARLREYTPWAKPDRAQIPFRSKRPIPALGSGRLARTSGHTATTTVSNALVQGGDHPDREQSRPRTGF